ncbi:MAG: hypothetical protein CMJ83_01530 [Planctomycetes bacterium]|nr:hypothetical protein [Planctomycetota bacterium]
MRDMRLLLAIALLGVGLLGGCGDDEIIQLFSRADCEKAVTAWAEAVLEGRLPDALEDTGTPFRFRSRLWGNPGEVKKGLGLQLADVKARLGAANHMECWPFLGLKDGDWPRGEVRDVSHVGVQPDGYVVVLKKSERTQQALMTLVVNPSPQRERLVIQGIDPQ